MISTSVMCQALPTAAAACKEEPAAACKVELAAEQAEEAAKLAAEQSEDELADWGEQCEDELADWGDSEVAEPSTQPALATAKAPEVATPATAAAAEAATDTEQGPTPTPAAPMSMSQTLRQWLLATPPAAAGQPPTTTAAEAAQPPPPPPPPPQAAAAPPVPPPPPPPPPPPAPAPGPPPSTDSFFTPGRHEYEGRDFKVQYTHIHAVRRVVVVLAGTTCQPMPDDCVQWLVGTQACAVIQPDCFVPKQSKRAKPFKAPTPHPSPRLASPRRLSPSLPRHPELVSASSGPAAAAARRAPSTYLDDIAGGGHPSFRHRGFQSRRLLGRHGASPRP